MIIEIDGELFEIKIQEKRMAARLSQTQLSKLSGVSSNYISEMEKGKYIPTVLTLLKISKALKCGIEELISSK